MSNKRNKAVEKEILQNFIKTLDGEFTTNEIVERLQENEFKGVYLLSDDEYDKTAKGANSIAQYSCDSKRIIIKESEYKKNKRVGVHEMGHAYIDLRSVKKVEIDGTYSVTCKGLEEGAVSLLERVTNIKNIDKVKISSCNYVPQTLLFRQLNTLYKESSQKKYDNLLIHLLKEPENFIVLIKDIYSSIFNDCNSLTILKSAYYMVNAVDAITTIDFDEVFFDLCSINTIYYCAGHPIDARNNNVKPEFEKFMNDNFKIPDSILLLTRLFGEFDYESYKNYLLDYINFYTARVVNYFDTLKNTDDPDELCPKKRILK